MESYAIPLPRKRSRSRKGSDYWSYCDGAWDGGDGHHVNEDAGCYCCSSGLTFFLPSSVAVASWWPNVSGVLTFRVVQSCWTFSFLCSIFFLTVLIITKRSVVESAASSAPSFGAGIPPRKYLLSSVAACWGSSRPKATSVIFHLGNDWKLFGIQDTENIDLINIAQETGPKGRRKRSKPRKFNPESRLSITRIYELPQVCNYFSNIDITNTN